MKFIIFSTKSIIELKVYYLRVTRTFLAFDTSTAVHDSVFKSSFLIYNSSITLQNSSILMQNSSILMQIATLNQPGHLQLQNRTGHFQSKIIIKQGNSASFLLFKSKFSKRKMAFVLQFANRYPHAPVRVGLNPRLGALSILYSNELCITNDELCTKNDGFSPVSSLQNQLRRLRTKLKRQRA